jgi:hypothetical protein
MNFIYGIDGKRKIVEKKEYDLLINNGSWFQTPSEAKNALIANKKTKGKRKNDEAVEIIAIEVTEGR